MDAKVSLPALESWTIIGQNGVLGLRSYTDLATGLTYIVYDNCVQGGEVKDKVNVGTGAVKVSPNVLLAKTGNFATAPGPFASRVSLNVIRDKGVPMPTVVAPATK
jgi:hypothetical protein